MRPLQRYSQTSPGGSGTNDDEERNHEQDIEIDRCRAADQKSVTVPHVGK